MPDGPHASDPLRPAMACMADGRFPDALDMLLDLDQSAFSPCEQGRALALEIVCLAQQDLDDDARRMLSRAMRRHPDDRAFQLALGIQLSECGAHDWAEKVLRRLSDRFADDPVPLFNLGVALEHDARCEEAVEAYRQAIARDSASACPEFHARLGHALQRMGRLIEAAAALREYLSQRPRDAHEWISLAIVCSNAEDYAKAREAYEKARELEPDSVSLHFNRAQTAARQDDRETLAACVATLERLAPEDWRTELARASLAERDGAAWQGWEACRRAFERAAGQAATLGCAEAEECVAIAAASTLTYAARNRLGEHAGEFVAQVFDAELFDECVLAALRRLEGAHSRHAREFDVLLEGRRNEASEDDGADPDEAPAPGARFFRSLRVWADDAEQAGQLALDFERRCGGVDLEIGSVERGAATGAAHLGVRWCSARWSYESEGDGPERAEP
ncbi:MAG: tetratricopeptide repeat protein [Planctomycetota bacterium]|nr:tetratricopeptide repeat protein [Planctomycetota bacterium]